MQCALAEESSDRRQPASIVGPRVAVIGQRAQERIPIPGAPPHDGLEVHVTLHADGLAESEETVVKHAVHFLSWSHDNLDAARNARRMQNAAYAGFVQAGLAA